MRPTLKPVCGLHNSRSFFLVFVLQCLYVPNLRLQRNGTVLEDEDVLFPEENQPFVTVHVLPNILGGKGGACCLSVSILTKSIVILKFTPLTMVLNPKATCCLM